MTESKTGPTDYVRSVGQGRPVVLIAGGASTAFDYFPDLEEALRSHAHVITIDAPGVGRRSDGRTLNVAAVAAGVAETLEQVGASGAVLVGHSLGGPVALRLAVDFPRLVSALVLLDPTPCAPDSAVRVVAAGFKAMRFGGPLGEVLWRRAARRAMRDVQLGAAGERALAVYCSPRFCRQASRWRNFRSDAAALTADIDARWPVDVQVLVVSAGHHKVTSPIRAAHEHLASRLPLGRLEVWPGTSHELHMQAPDRVAAAVARVLTGVNDLPEH